MENTKLSLGQFVEIGIEALELDAWCLISEKFL